jgi:hypothetical protein
MPLVLVASAYFAWKARDMPHLGRFHDAGIYWVCAKSLAQSSGYRILSLPDQPYQTKYPPLYPLLLSVIWRVNPSYPDNLPLATLVSWLMLPLYLILARRIFLDLGLGPVHALVLCVLLALNPYVVLYSVSLMSELMFSCLLLGCLWLAKRAGDPGSAWWLAGLAGAVAAAAYLTRNAALPLLASGPLYYLLRKQYARAALFFGAMLPAVAGWNLWVRAHLPASSDFVTLYYTDYLRFHLANFTWGDLPLLLSKNLGGLLAGIGGLFMVFGAQPLLQILGVLAIFGTLRMVRRCGVSQYHLFAAGHVLLLLPWHLGLYDQYVRLVLPILPLLLAGLSSEFRRAAVQVHAWFKTPGGGRMLLACALSVGVGFVAVVGALSVFVTLYQFPGFLNRSRVLLANNRAAYRWIAENLPRDSAFLAGADPQLYLYTGRPACHFVVPPRLLYLNDQAKISELYRRVAEYGRAHRLSHAFLNVGGESGGDLGLLAGKSVLTGSPGFQLLYRSGTASVYRIE